MKKIALFFTIALICNACVEYIHETIPYVKVDFTISIGDPNYYMLNHDGGHVYLTGGVNGIIVYRLGIEYPIFKAYDRACPYDWEKQDSWLWYDPASLTIYDTCCGARFNIIDGTVVKFPDNGTNRALPLKYYRATFDGRVLRIKN